MQQGSCRACRLRDDHEELLADGSGVLGIQEVAGKMDLGTGGQVRRTFRIRAVRQGGPDAEVEGRPRSEAVGFSTLAATDSHADVDEPNLAAAAALVHQKRRLKGRKCGLEKELAGRGKHR